MNSEEISNEPIQIHENSVDPEGVNGHDRINTLKGLRRKLLVICHSYNNFQKDSIDATSKYFANVDVFVRTNPFSEISNYLPIPNLERFSKINKIDLTHKPLNLQVVPTPLLYFPLDSSYQSLGEKHFRAVDKLIPQNQLGFDIVHSHFTWSAGYVGARIKKKFAIPFVVTVHGYDIYALPFKNDGWKERIEFVLNAADKIIAVSKSTRDCVKNLDVSTPVTIIPNGFRKDLFFPRNTSECKKALNIPPDKKIILTVGNLEPVKAQKHLIEAIKLIISERKDILCVIIGSGSLEKALERQIRSSNLSDYVMLTGGKPHNEIPLWINACDLFVLPSINEGNPTVMFEALGCGKPFIGTSVGGIPEVIISDDYGFLVKPESPRDLADVILEGLERDWNKNKILYYAERFTWDNIAFDIIDVYNHIYP